MWHGYRREDGPSKGVCATRTRCSGLATGHSRGCNVANPSWNQVAKYLELMLRSAEVVRNHEGGPVSLPGQTDRALFGEWSGGRMRVPAVGHTREQSA